MTIVNDIDLTSIRLDKGGHSAKKTPGEWCIMEAAAWAAGEDWSSSPECVSPVIRSFCITFNDRLDDTNRQKLAPYIFKVIGTNDGRDDERRLLAATKFSTLLPEWLDLAGLPAHAEKVRALGVLTTYEQWVAARSVMREVRDAAYNRRREVREPLRAKVREAVMAEYAKRGKPVAVADAAADAVAVAVAVADADAVVAAVAAAVVAADAAAVADAVADAVAVAVAVADADAVVAAAAVAVAVADADAVVAAVAVAVADADAVADAASSDHRYWKVRDAVYKAVKPIYEKAIADNPALSEMVERTNNIGFELLDEMCAVGRG